MPFACLEPLAAPRTVALLDRLAALDSDLERGATHLVELLFAAAGSPDAASGAAAARARLATVALRRAVFNRRDLRPADREAAGPRLSPELRDHLDAYTARRAEHTRLTTELETTCTTELAVARAALCRVLPREEGGTSSEGGGAATSAANEVGGTPTWGASTFASEFEVAIRLVSRRLAERLRRLGRVEAWRHEERHAAAKLLAYVDRAATKTSPNGLFCATALAAWSCTEKPAGVSGDHRLDRQEVLLNVVEARKVAACLASDPAVRSALVARVNPTLREDGETWTFWRPASLAREGDEEILRRLKRHPVAEAMVELARSMPLTVPELLTATAERTGLSTDELTPFFTRLAEAGLFLGEIEIPYTSRRPLADLASIVRRAGLQPPWLAEIEAVDAAVKNLATLPSGPRIRAMDHLAHRLDGLPHTRPLEPDELFRVDAASPLRVTLPAEIADELRRAIGAYARMFAAIYPRRTLRRRVARAFLAEHGADCEVCLLDLYRGSPLPDGGGRPLGFPEAEGTPGNDGSRALERARRWFVRQALDARADDRDEVPLTEADWDHLAGRGGEPPWAAGVLFQVAAASPNDLAAGRFRLAVNDLFTGAGLALSRFAHLHGPADPGQPNPIVEEMRRAVRRLIPPGTLPAEVTYNHWGRAANAGLRPPFLEHEIELPGERASEGAVVIPLRELVLHWSSEEERFVLRWPKRGVEVVPVLSSGVAPEGFVSLLVAVGRQAIQPLSYLPGFATGEVTRWPRFVHGRVVLFRRRWIYPPGSFPEPPAEAAAPDRLLGDFFRRLHRWRRREELPRHVFAATNEDPKPFHLDLESPLHADLLRHRLAPRRDETPPGLVLTEMLPAPGEIWARDGAGRYATEFLVQLGSAGEP